MAVYKGPVKDITFVLNEVLDVASLAKLPGYEDATPDTIQAILEEAAKLCENVLFPLNRTGDEKTAVRFRLDAEGKVVNVDQRPKSLLETFRNVRANAS